MGNSRQLVLPGGQKEQKRFNKEMKKLRADWVSKMSRKYARGGPSSIYSMADLHDSLIDTYIGYGTHAALNMIFKLDQGRDEAYEAVVDADAVIIKYGGKFSDPLTITGVLLDHNFAEESQRILAEKKRDLPMNRGFVPDTSQGSKEEELEEALVEEDEAMELELWKSRFYSNVAHADAATVLNLLQNAKAGLEVGALSEEEYRTIKDRLLRESSLTGESMGVDLESDSSGCPKCGGQPVIPMQTGYYECTRCGEALGLAPTEQPANGYDGPLFYVPGFSYADEGLSHARFLDGYHRVLVDDSIVPPVDAAWADVRKLARSFNAHSELLSSSTDSEVTAGVKRLETLLDSAYDDWTAGSGISEDMTLLELRRILSYMAEFHIHQGSDPAETGYGEFISGLLEAIRDKVAMDRALDPSPLTPGEQFARFTLDLAKAIQPASCLATPLSTFSLSDLQDLIAKIDEKFQLPERDRTLPWLNLLDYQMGEVDAIPRPPQIPQVLRRPTAEDIAIGFSISDLVEIWLPHVISFRGKSAVGGGR